MQLHPRLGVTVSKGDRPKQIGWFTAVVDFLLAMEEPPFTISAKIFAGPILDSRNSEA